MADHENFLNGGARLEGLIVALSHIANQQQQLLTVPRPGLCRTFKNKAAATTRINQSKQT